jgi:VanZ family protein/uncharacterized membrane protein
MIRSLRVYNGWRVPRSGFRETPVRILLAVCILAIVYLSLYPFHFVGDTHGKTLIFSLPQMDSDWVDIIANVALYIPLGFIGMAAWRRNYGVGAISVFLLGVVLSTSMELAQIHLPTRDSNVRDIMCNGAGTLAGCVAHWIGRDFRLRVALPRPAPAAWILIFFWCFWQLFPFIPTLRRYKLTEILTQASLFSFHGAEFCDFLLAAILIYALVVWPGKQANSETLLLVFVILVPVLLMQSLIVGLTISDLRLAGVCCGLIVAFCFWRPEARIHWIVMSLGLILWTAVREFAVPGQLAAVTHPQGWLSMAPYVRTMAGRTFYGWGTIAAMTCALRYGGEGLGRPFSAQDFT